MYAAVPRITSCSVGADHTIKVELGFALHRVGRFSMHLITKHRFGRAQVDLAGRSVGGQGTPEAVHVTVLLWS